MGCLSHVNIAMTPPPKQRQHRHGRNTRNHASQTSARRRTKVSVRNLKPRLKQQTGYLSCKNSLNASFLNVDGLSEVKLEEVTSTVLSTSPDIFFLLETKRREEEIGIDISVPGYELSEIKRSDVSGDRAGGGIAVYTKSNAGLLFKQHNPAIANADLEFVQNERFWVTIDSLQCKTAICGVYMGCQLPRDNHGDWNDGIYWVLRQECESLRSSGYRIIVLGDMNGHIGDQPGRGISGNNPDINRNGERFLSFLRDCDLRHLNGELRVPGDTASKICSGLWTRQRGNSRSILDYASISAEYASTVVSMTVDDSGALGGGSDHNWVSLTLADKFRRLCKVPKISQKSKSWNLTGEFQWSDYTKAVLKHLPVDGWDDLPVDTHASKLVSALYKAGELVVGFKHQRKKTSMRSKSLPAHIVAALKLKRDLEKTWKSLSSSENYDSVAVSAAEKAFVTQKNVVENLFTSLTASKRLKNFGVNGLGGSKSSRSKFWSAVTGKVKQSSSFTSVISPSGTLETDNDAIGTVIENHLCDIFQGSSEPIPIAKIEPVPDHSYCSTSSPLNAATDHVYNKVTLPSLPYTCASPSLENNPSDWLGRDFSVAEVQKIASTLNNGKAFGWDHIPSEFLKNAPSQAIVVMTSLFNKIKNTGILPSGWNCGRITLVHKKGLRAKLGNYRPITVLVSLSSFFSKLLNERLINVVEAHGLLGEAQNGFRQGRCGADNIFVLNTILWKAKALEEKVHLGFVDISKAYDSVNRDLLWRKLEKIGIRGAFLDALKALYSGDSVRCMFNNTKTRPVYLRRGLRQGCSLSPLLFAIYISDIGDTLSNSSLGFTLDGQPIAGLLFADDIVLISKTAAGLKTLFGLVKSHCDDLLLDINTGEGKSEIISPTEDVWDILDDEGEVVITLRQVLKYKYLGLESFLSPAQTCRVKQAKCIQTANKYKFACLHIGRTGPDVVDATLATWVNIAIPSILFGCESILFTETTVLSIERVQAQVTKRLLGLPSNTANICTQTELGIIPFRLALYQAQLSFYFRVLDLPSTRWAKKAMLEHLSMEWQSPYFRYISEIRASVHMNFFPPTTRYLKSHLYTWSLSEVNSTLADLSLPYVAPMKGFKKQPYVFEHPHLDTIAQFRLSNSGLGNRSPRWAGTQYPRISQCPLCTSAVSEDHVILACPSIETERKNFGITFFRNRCQDKGWTLEASFSSLLNFVDPDGAALPRTEIVRIGLVLDTLRGFWLSKW